MATKHIQVILLINQNYRKISKAIGYLSSNPNVRIKIMNWLTDVTQIFVSIVCVFKLVLHAFFQIPIITAENMIVELIRTFHDYRRTSYNFYGDKTFWVSIKFILLSPKPQYDLFSNISGISLTRAIGFFAQCSIWGSRAFMACTIV